MVSEFKPILEVNIGHSRNLEAILKKDFGEAGFARFKEHNVQVKINPGYSYTKGIMTISSPFFVELECGDLPGSSGKVYRFHSFPEIGLPVYGVRAVNANVELEADSINYGPLRRIALTFDLNPQNESARYLRMVFDLSMHNAE